jgi:hypothetical protein
VVDGLQVGVDGAAGAQTVTIGPGLAIDGRGEEIEVTSAVVLPLPAKGKQLLVQINYAERLSRPVPVAAQSANTAETRPSRVEETFRAYVAPEAKAVAVSLARLTCARGRWTLDRKFKVPRTRGTLAAR